MRDLDLLGLDSAPRALRRTAAARLDLRALDEETLLRIAEASDVAEVVCANPTLTAEQVSWLKEMALDGVARRYAVDESPRWAERVLWALCGAGRIHGEQLADELWTEVLARPLDAEDATGAHLMAFYLDFAPRVSEERLLRIIHRLRGWPELLSKLAYKLVLRPEATRAVRREMATWLPHDRRLLVALASDPRSHDDPLLRTQLLGSCDLEVIAVLLPGMSAAELDGVLRGFEEMARDERDADWAADWALNVLDRTPEATLRDLPRARLDAWLSAQEREQRLAAIGLLTDWIRLQVAPAGAANAS